MTESERQSVLHTHQVAVIVVRNSRRRHKLMEAINVETGNHSKWLCPCPLLTMTQINQNFAIEFFFQKISEKNIEFTENSEKLGRHLAKSPT